MGGSDDTTKPDLTSEVEMLRTQVAALEQEAALRRRAERDLEASESRYRTLVETMNDGLGVQDERGMVVYANDKLCRMLGYARQELVGRPATDFVAEESRDGFREEAARRTRGDRAPYEMALLRKDGERVYVLVSPVPILGPDSEYRGSFGVLTDITDRKRNEEAVLSASRMEATATLAGGIAHDFNNLMVGVLGNAELLQMRIGQDPDVNRMLATIQKSAQQAGELAQQMLAFARGGKYEPRVMNLNHVIEETLHLEEHSFPPRIRIEHNLEADLWNVTADPVQMSQVVMNLSLNAVEAIPETGRIRFTTANVDVDEAFARAHPGLRAGRYVCFMVEDTGRGMSAEVRARVFEPFFTTKFQGRGLGLAAVYGIVKNHEGYISVDSEPGRGSSLRVYLPAVTAQEHAQPMARGEARLTGTETILVIDDEPVVRSVTREVLEHFGYHVVSAADGREAVELARSHKGAIDLALLDLGMPVMGGAQAYPLLMAARPGLKVIILSGYELDPAAQALLDAGAAAFVHKPFRTRALVAKIRKALDAKL